MKTKLLFGIICMGILLSCSDNEEKSTGIVKSPRVVKECKLELPVNNTQFRLGESISFKIGTRNEGTVIDSILLEALNEKIIFTQREFNWTAAQGRVGTPKIKLTVYVNGKG